MVELVATLALFGAFVIGNIFAVFAILWAGGVAAKVIDKK